MEDQKLKTLHIEKIPEDTYFKLVELKGKLRASTWVEFLQKITAEGDFANDR